MDAKPITTRTKSLEARNLLFFFLIAFGWTWLWWFLLIQGKITIPEGIGTPDIQIGANIISFIVILVSPFGPTIGAWVITGLTEGKTGLKNLWRRFWSFRINFKWVKEFVFKPRGLRQVEQPG